MVSFHSSHLKNTHAVGLSVGCYKDKHHKYQQNVLEFSVKWHSAH